MSKQPPGTDSKKALLDAFDQVLQTQQQEQEERRAEAKQRSSGRPAAITWVLVFVSLFAVAYIWLERPTWIFPAPPPPESVAVKEASLRIALANAARHVEHFRRAKGQLPAALEDTGMLPAAGIMYEVTNGDAWVLRGSNGAVQLTLQSSDSLRPFVGNSFHVLTQRSR